MGRKFFIYLALGIMVVFAVAIGGFLIWHGLRFERAKKAFLDGDTRSVPVLLSDRDRFIGFLWKEIKKADRGVVGLLSPVIKSSRLNGTPGIEDLDYKMFIAWEYALFSQNDGHATALHDSLKYYPIGGQPARLVNLLQSGGPHQREVAAKAIFKYFKRENAMKHLMDLYKREAENNVGYIAELFNLHTFTGELREKFKKLLQDVIKGDYKVEYGDGSGSVLYGLAYNNSGIVFTTGKKRNAIELMFKKFKCEEILDFVVALSEDGIFQYQKQILDILRMEPGYIMNMKMKFVEKEKFMRRLADLKPEYKDYEKSIIDDLLILLGDKRIFINSLLSKIN